jgi:hypothetical protein
MSNNHIDTEVTLAQVTVKDVSRIFKAYREETQNTLQAMQRCAAKASTCEPIPDSTPVLEASSTGSSWELAAGKALVSQDILRLSSSFQSEKNVRQFGKAKTRAWRTPIARRRGVLWGFRSCRKRTCRRTKVSRIDCPYFVPTSAAAKVGYAATPAGADSSNAEY